MRKILKIMLGTLALGAVLPLTITAQTKSAKRGLCWDENKQSMSNEPIGKMLPGVSWIYNWGVCPAKEVSTLNAKGEWTITPCAGRQNMTKRSFAPTWMRTPA